MLQHYFGKGLTVEQDQNSLFASLLLLSLPPCFQAFNYIWENHRDDADWFIKVDDDTYLIMENLK